MKLENSTTPVTTAHNLADCLDNNQRGTANIRQHPNELYHLNDREEDQQQRSRYYCIQPAEPTYVTQPSPIPSCNEGWAKLVITRMDQTQAETREAENKNRYLENIEMYSGGDKTKCLLWVN